MNHAQAADVYLQLGAVVFALGLGARAASRAGLSPIPLYLLAGLVLGSIDIPALQGEFVQFAADLGVILLLFIIGLEYTAEELTGHLRRFRRIAALDAALNFAPGFALALLLGWDVVAAIVLGGVTWISSSSIALKALSDLGRLRERETPAIVSILVAEDLAMAGFLPLVASLLVGGGVLASLGSLLIAAVAATATLVGAIRFGESLGRIVSHHSEEVVLLSALGLVLSSRAPPNGCRSRPRSARSSSALRSPVRSRIARAISSRRSATSTRRCSSSSSGCSSTPRSCPASCCRCSPWSSSRPWPRRSSAGAPRGSSAPARRAVRAPRRR